MEIAVLLGEVGFVSHKGMMRVFLIQHHHLEFLRERKTFFMVTLSTTAEKVLLRNI